MSVLVMIDGVLVVTINALISSSRIFAAASLTVASREIVSTGEDMMSVTRVGSFELIPTFPDGRFITFAATPNTVTD
jgi:hypothetical protein